MKNFESQFEAAMGFEKLQNESLQLVIKKIKDLNLDINVSIIHDSIMLDGEDSLSFYPLYEQMLQEQLHKQEKTICQNSW